ncbi:MAG: autotransporter domain-containing protein [Devosia sp.]|nr:autotransporter domain-containing protein [Devosia sp.]
MQLGQYVLWTRLNATLSSGTAERSGIGAGAQAGIVVELDPRLDVGGFVMGYASRQEAASVDGSLDSASLGAGLYTTYDLTDNVTAGLTLSGERGFHDSSVAGVTGSFTRDMLRLEGSLSGDYQVGEVTVTPRAGFEWLYSSRSSYVDSSSLVHPTITSNELIGTLGIEVRQSFVQEFGNDLLLVTPRAGLAVNGHAGRDETLDLGGGVTVEQSNLYLTASTGLAVELGDGMTADFGLSVGGIGDSLQSLSATASLRAPLN